MKHMLSLLLCLGACRSLARVDTTTNARIGAFTVDNAAVTEGDEVTLSARFSGTDADVVGTGPNAVAIASDTPLTFTAALSSLGAVQEQALLLRVRGAGAEAQRSITVAVHKRPTAPTIIAGENPTLGDSEVVARVETLPGFTAVWAVEGAGVLVASSRTAVTWAASALGEAIIRCTLFNGLQVASEPSELRVQVVGSETYAGVDGVFGYQGGDRLTAQFSMIAGLAKGSDGAVYVIDGSDAAVEPNNALRRIDMSGQVSTFSGPSSLVPVAGRIGGASGAAGDARYRNPRSLAALSGGRFVIADLPSVVPGSGDSVGLRLVAADGSSTPVPLDPAFAAGIFVAHVASDVNDNIYVLACTSANSGCSAGVYRFALGETAWQRWEGGYNISPSLRYGALAVEPDGSAAYVGETGTMNSSFFLWRVTATERSVLAGSGKLGTQDGPRLEARIGEVISIAREADGRFAFIDVNRTTSPYSRFIRRVDGDRVVTLGGVSRAAAPPRRVFANDVFDLISVGPGELLLGDVFTVQRLRFP